MLCNTSRTGLLVYWIMEDISSEEEEKKTEESLTSNEIREMCKMWETAKFCRETPPEQGCNSASNEYFQ